MTYQSKYDGTEPRYLGEHLHRSHLHYLDHLSLDLEAVRIQGRVLLMEGRD